MEPITYEEYARAVVKLVKLAHGDTGGSRAAAQVVLSAYNGNDWQLDITDLCTLDHEHYKAALAVIRGRAEIKKEPHYLISDGSEHFQRLWAQWERYHIDKRWRAECGNCYGSGKEFEDDDEYGEHPIKCFKCGGEGLLMQGRGL